MRKLGEVKAAVNSGIHPVEEFAEPVLWHQGSNVISSEQALRPTAGQFPFLPKVDNYPILGMQDTNITTWTTTQVGKYPQLWWGSTERLYGYFHNGGGIFDYTPSPAFTTRARNEFWSIVEFNDSIFAASGTPLYKFSDADTEFVKVTTAPDFTTAKILAKLDRMLFAFNTDLGGKHYAWSDRDDGTDFVNTADNTAAASYMREMNGNIVAVVPFANGLAVFGPSQMFFVRPLGFPLYFSHKKLLDGIGAFSPYSVVTVGNRIYGFGPEGMWVTDGATYRYIDRPSAYNYVFANFTSSTELQALSHVWHNQMEKMLVFFWVSKEGSEIDRAIGYNYQSQTWWPVSYNRTVGIEGANFTFAILGDHNGNIFQQAQAASAPDPGTDVLPPWATPGATGQPLVIDEKAYTVSLFDGFGFGTGPFGDD